MNKRKNISNHGPEEKEKSFLGKKERKDQPRPSPWKKIKGYLVSGQKKTKKPSCEFCNATITKVLNIKQWSQL